MESVRRSVALAPRAPAARTSAVALTPVARFADRERHPAPAAKQQVQHHLRHQPLGHAIKPRAEWTDERGGAILRPPRRLVPPRRPTPPGLLLRGRDDTPHPQIARRGYAADDDGVVRSSTARQKSAVFDRRSQEPLRSAPPTATSDPRCGANCVTGRAVQSTTNNAPDACLARIGSATSLLTTDLVLGHQLRVGIGSGQGDATWPTPPRDGIACHRREPVPTWGSAQGCPVAEESTILLCPRSSKSPRAPPRKRRSSISSWRTSAASPPPSGSR